MARRPGTPASGRQPPRESAAEPHNRPLLHRPPGTETPTSGRHSPPQAGGGTDLILRDGAEARNAGFSQSPDQLSVGGRRRNRNPSHPMNRSHRTWNTTPGQTEPVSITMKPHTKAPPAAPMTPRHPWAA